MNRRVTTLPQTTKAESCAVAIQRELEQTGRSFSGAVPVTAVWPLVPIGGNSGDLDFEQFVYLMKTRPTSAVRRDQICVSHETFNMKLSTVSLPVRML